MKHLPDPSSMIRTEDGSAFHATTNWIMAALLLGAAGAVVWFFRPLNFDFDSPEFNPVIFLPIFLGGYGLYHLASGLMATLRVRKFGLSTLDIQGASVSMGATFRGVVRTPVELHPKSDYEVRLQCVETFSVRGDNGPRDVDRIRWETSTRVPPAAVNSKQGIPFELTLPKPFEKSQSTDLGPVRIRAVAVINVPGLQSVLARNQQPASTRWVLEIKAPLDGVDYYAIFGVIVEDTYGSIAP